MTFFEELPYSVNIKELQEFILSNIISLENPIFSGDKFGYNDFGGYSLLSRTGDWRDGWQVGCIGKPGQTILDPNNVNFRAAKYLNLSHNFEHKNPTAFCKGPILDIINDIIQMGFYPRRARLSMLKANSQTILHSDGDRNDYMCRLHIPIITNESCVHRCHNYDLHMPSDGRTYILKVNVPHQVFNSSTINRYHIIMDCWDTKFITKKFRYFNNIKDLENDSLLYRKAIDSISLTEDEIKKYEQLIKKFMQ